MKPKDKLLILAGLLVVGGLLAVSGLFRPPASPPGPSSRTGGDAGTAGVRLSPVRPAPDGEAGDVTGPEAVAGDEAGPDTGEEADPLDGFSLDEPGPTTLAVRVLDLAAAMDAVTGDGRVPLAVLRDGERIEVEVAPGVLGAALEEFEE